MNKVWDVTPATNFIQVFVAKIDYDLCGLTIRRREIEVQFIDSSNPLGTQDGQSYSVYPQLPDNDEDGQHGRK